MNQLKYARLAALMKIDLFCSQAGEIQAHGRHCASNPLWTDEDFRARFRAQMRSQRVPCLWWDENHILFGGVCRGEEELWFGPIAMQVLTMPELNRYRQKYGLPADEQPPVIMGLSEVISLTGLLEECLCGTAHTDAEILEGNPRLETWEGVESEELLFELMQDEEEFYHNSYQKEQALLNLVKEGEAEEAIRLNMEMDDEIGKLAEDQIEHCRNMILVSITLCTRAAIEGGVSPEEAYRISDFYILQSECCTSDIQLISCRNQAVRVLAERVRRARQSRRLSMHVERAMDYIRKHYREKIVLDEIADRLGLNSSYLSHLFAREAGISIQKYVQQVRVEKACNLLRLSDMSLAEIGQYVGFPNQSYFGRVFRELIGMTPKEYRESSRPGEIGT